MLPKSPTCDFRGILIASQCPLGFTALLLRSAHYIKLKAFLQEHPFDNNYGHF